MPACGWSRASPPVPPGARRGSRAPAGTWAAPRAGRERGRLPPGLSAPRAPGSRPISRTPEAAPARSTACGAPGSRLHARRRAAPRRRVATRISRPTAATLRRPPAATSTFARRDRRAATLPARAGARSRPRAPSAIVQGSADARSALQSSMRYRRRPGASLPPSATRGSPRGPRARATMPRDHGWRTGSGGNRAREHRSDTRPARTSGRSP